MGKFGIVARGGSSGGSDSSDDLSDSTRLANLQISVGQFDQIFQPGQKSYVAIPGFVASNIQ